jgi:hypothetical protein
MNEVGVGTKIDEAEDSNVKSTLKEISVSTSVGGKVQIVQYQNSQDYHYSISQKWDVEGIESEEDAWDFRQEKISELRDHLEEVAQREMDGLIKQRDELRDAS